MNKIAMQKSNFYDMSICSRTQYIWLYGSYTMSRDYLNYTIALYELSGFFVEVWYSELADEVERIEILDDDCQLDLYLPYIDISNLVEEI